MAGRKIILATGQYYHIFNRGIARQPTFFSKTDYTRFILTLSYYRNTYPQVKLSRYLQLNQEVRKTLQKQLLKSNQKLVEIICFTLMPNHFHLLLKQTEEKGISRFMSQIMNSYTRYINTKKNRVGDLFQGVFKAVHTESEEQLVHLSRYIHLNPVVSYIISEKELFTYPWSSLPDYLKGEPSWITLDIITKRFKTKELYKKFLLDQIDYGKKLEEIKHIALEE